MEDKNGSATKPQKISEPVACEEGPGIFAKAMALGSLLLVIFSLPVSLFFVVKVVQEYERAVIFRLGRLLVGGARGPGVFFILPCVDTYEKVDMRTHNYEIPPQEILTKDSVTVFVNAIMYYKVKNAIHAVANVDDYGGSARLLAATTLRNVLGTMTLGEILSTREKIATEMKETLDVATEPWGVRVERVEVKDVRVPEQLMRAMAAEAEAAREARAKVIAAEGEHRASRALRHAAEVIVDSPAALQLRYLQTLNSISAENNSTVIFPVPIDIMNQLMTGLNNRQPQYPVYLPQQHPQQYPQQHPTQHQQQQFQPPHGMPKPALLKKPAPIHGQQRISQKPLRRSIKKSKTSDSEDLDLEVSDIEVPDYDLEADFDGNFDVPDVDFNVSDI